MPQEKVRTTRGIYAGVLDPRNGKLLLIRRMKKDSIIPGQSFFGNWELPGGAVMTTDVIFPYNWYLKELHRLVQEKAGITIAIHGLPPMYSVMFKDPRNGDYDEASVIPFVFRDAPTSDHIYVSPTELDALAEEFKPANEAKGISGTGLLSGRGKRQHCMALAALCKSPNIEFADLAERMLRRITDLWV